MNKYHSFYLEDIERLASQTALSLMRSPATLATNGVNVQKHNDRMAFYNDGVRKMAEKIIDALRAEAEEGEPNE